MTRLIYALVWFGAIPFVLVRLAWRNRRQGGYLERLGERFGNYNTRREGPYIWIHAVSLGETRAAIPLVEALRQRRGDQWPLDLAIVIGESPIDCGFR